jgi:type II secretory pathway component PulL
MINLLPAEMKTGYSYARRNVYLRKWVIIFLIALLGLGGIATYGLLSLRASTLQYDKQISQSETTLKKQDYSATQKRIQDIGGSFKLVVKVLGQEVLFSQLIKQVATAIPPNSNLTGLNISQTQGALDITVNAIDYNTATQVQVNLADPANKIFSKADIVSINCNSKNNAKSQYPCDITIRALFANNNPFLFINSKAGKP